MLCQQHSNLTLTSSELGFNIILLHDLLSERLKPGLDKINSELHKKAFNPSAVVHTEGCGGGQGPATN